MFLPLTFIEQTKSLLHEEWDAFADALQKPAPVSIRLNDKWNASLPYDHIAWCDSGYYLPKRIIFTLDPLFHAGAYYVQEASSQFLDYIIKHHIRHPVIALDLCAAPGGKSTLLLNALHPSSFLVSNEIIHSRANILSENIQKWGNSNVAVTNRQPKDFQRLPSLFDLLVIDVPCSGEGMFRKDPDAIQEWSPSNVAQCAIRQRDIVSDAWDALKEGGWLIYSTCTYNQEENEKNIRWIIEELGAERINITIDDTWGITVSDEGYRFFPHKARGEGLFITLLRKTATAPKASKNKMAHHGLLFAQHDYAKQFLPDQQWGIGKTGNFLFAFHKQYQEIITQIIQAYSPLFIGTLMGEIKGKDFIPHTALALSKLMLYTQKVQTIDLDVSEAVRFLQKENISQFNEKKEYQLITFRHIPLGWIKNLGSRSNNLYPSAWHIRMKTNGATIYESPLLIS
ncbi:methyltransferase RsmF C-terminal domain-like protein [Microbacter margulisiae]|uniref:16S rRNA C967 or C1407 C5-methylase (RsmB/RsmF family)/NOL1/NOP2/fmu family ribosome biogenesis protein n=1 Tax=Microbacter margulisiae TaxID=1350067 RepID=A0A7W5DPZ7_9PORP|nr:rRNA cytosine-C5-methyltransferase [Microbacter margulisiae]MBB3186841.1 16S rRNA C967 or C1407 C5-methylase (RsmB/RsmF family)/NOL1/NOP2/fmu family ribosome biogenesis protein [Microbacter margulisiae]